MRGNQHGTIASMLAGKLPEFQYKNWNSGSFCVAKHINNWSRGKKQFSRLCMAHFFSRRYHIFGGQTVKFHVISNKLLNQSNGSSCHERTEESTDADSIKMMKDCKRQNHSRCEAGEIKGCLDLVILFMQKFRQIPRKNIGRDNRQQAVVGETDAEAHQKKSGEKADYIQRQNVRQQGNPGIVHVDHFSKSDADNKRKQIAGTERTLQNHQCDDEQRLKDIVPRSETEKRKRGAEDERHGGNR